ncbi:MAG: porphobilinogen synthase [Chthoniobacterales bacterium]|jgi:porphobilinogen synthase|nr:porphobilinogen synthase [Chthoniobacterales bacterium]
MELKTRMRRLRRSDGLRRMTRETRLDVADLVYPLFVHAGNGNEPVSSMPGVERRSLKDLVRECREAFGLGIPAVAIFPVIDRAKKDPRGRHALSPDNLLFRALREVKSAMPELVVIADVALDPYTDHGHDGVLTGDGRDVDNDPTVEILCHLAVLEAEAGADIVAPSDMMDGRIGAVRAALDAAGRTDTCILSYAAKFASAYYGPFRDAVGSAQSKPISKATYQLDPANLRAALLEVELDELEGADMVMVKPAGPYLDVIRAVRENTKLPLAAYQVSGEYAQIHAAAKAGWLDYEKARDESLLAIKRAGADIILTYFAREAAEVLRG